jgi:hypothetical protein
MNATQLELGIDRSLLSSSVIGAGRARLQHDTNDPAQALALLEKMTTTENASTTVLILLEQELPHAPKLLSQYVQTYVQQLISRLVLLDPFYMQAELTCRLFLQAGASLYTVLAAAINALSMALLNAGIPLRNAFFAIDFHDSASFIVISTQQKPQILAFEGSPLSREELSTIIPPHHSELVSAARKALAWQ